MRNETVDYYTQVMVRVNNHVHLERLNQNQKYGRQNHSNGEWLAILIEEVGESAQAMQQGTFASKDTDKADLYEELIHVAAVASAWAEQVIRDMKEEKI